jgi:UDP-N-acetylmuramate: L-alanyl-gamma-D-glutamyl-meso-diaminopimelate ligase
MDTENINNVNTPLLSPALNKIPPQTKTIYLMGICGTGMASLAGMLKQEGYSVTGSDQNVYPPMSRLLEDLSIPVLKGYNPANLDPPPDLVVVGNVITRDNPEALQLSRLAIPYISLPQALKHFALKGKSTIVVAGTHGKTTTSALVAWVLEKAGMDPGFMIGGIVNNFQRNFKIGDGPFFIVEGDEYDTAFFDKGSKFLHYSPWIMVLSSIEFDHADIFRDLEHLVQTFRRLIDLIPSDGLLIINGDDPIVVSEAGRAKCPVITCGLNRGLQWRAVDLTPYKEFTQVRILRKGKEYASLLTPLYGIHNISNLLSAVAVSEFLGIDTSILSEAVSNFAGVRRRQELKGEKAGVLVLDDFAHHPTAVEKTIGAVREKYGARRLIAVFEPRSNSSRRKVFQERYASSFDMADLVFIPEPPMMEKIPEGERFSSVRLVDSLNERGLKAFYFTHSDNLLKELLTQVRKGDVVLFMSNGSFDHIHDRLLEML